MGKDKIERAWWLLLLLYHTVFPTARIAPWLYFVGGGFEHTGVFYAAYVKRDILIQTVSDRIFRGPQPRSLSFVVTGARSAANAASTAENLMVRKFSQLILD